jgi:hypothetical protein
LPRRATTDLFELPNTGDNSLLTIGPRYRPPISDDLILSVRHHTTGDGRSVLLGRAQVREVLDWLTAWYEHGWPGVARTEGPTTADVIEHYRDIAVRERIRADHERIDAHRLLHAAIALVPADCRSQDLDEAALDQGRVWKRLDRERDHLEHVRRGLVQGLCDIEFSTTGSADALRKAAGNLLRRVNKPFTGEVNDAEAADTPLYRWPRRVTAAELLPTRDSTATPSP